MRFLEIEHILELTVLSLSVPEEPSACVIEEVVLAVASGQLSREELADWIDAHLISRK